MLILIKVMFIFSFSLFLQYIGWRYGLPYVYADWMHIFVLNATSFVEMIKKIRQTVIWSVNTSFHFRIKLFENSFLTFKSIFKIKLLSEALILHCHSDESCYDTSVITSSLVKRLPRLSVAIILHISIGFPYLSVCQLQSNFTSQ